MVVSEPALDYVAPPLHVLHDEPKAKITVVMAPAATGKTALARYISGSSGAPLWDVHDLQVGNSTFSGEAMQAFGTAGARLLGLVHGEGVPVVVDALDEAQLRAGETNFDAFCRDLCRTFFGPDAAQCILLARSETATFVQLVLEDLNLPFTHVRLDYFDEEAARAFIDLRLRVRAEQNRRQPLQQRHQRKYRENLDSVFATIEELVAPGVRQSEKAWRRDAVRSFLGYAPVLQAVADYLDDEAVDEAGEPLQFAPRGDAADQQAPWILLRNIVDHILDREHGKFVAACKKALDVADIYGWDDWDSLFTREEQIERVILWHADSNDKPTNQPVQLPGFLTARYEELVADHLPQHAFLSEVGPYGRSFANTVFDEYASANTLMRPESTASAVVRERLSRQSPLASPLLARFILTTPPPGKLSFSDAPYFYYSIRESTDALRDAWINIIHNSSGSPSNIDVSWSGGDIAVRLDGGASEVLLVGRVRDLGIVVDDLRLGSGGDLHLGPLVVLGGTRVTIHSERVVVHGTNTNGDQLIGGGEMFSNPAHQRVLVDDGTDLIVDFNHSVPHQYRNFVPNAPDPSEDADTDFLALYFWRILSRFRGSQSALGRLRCSALLIERVEVGRSPLGQKVLTHLIEIGLIIRSGTDFYLSSGRLADLGLTFTDIRLRHKTPQLESMLIKLVSRA